MIVGDKSLDIINKTLAGLRPVDEQTQACLEVLNERLESLKRTSNLFAGVSFSRDVEKLAAQAAVS